jgi:hypothetical protein
MSVENYNWSLKEYCTVVHSGDESKMVRHDLKWDVLIKTDISAFSSGLRGHMRLCLTILDSSRRPLSEKRSTLHNKFMVIMEFFEKNLFKKIIFCLGSGFFSGSRNKLNKTENPSSPYPRALY